MDTLVGDIRLALRRLVRERLFSLIAIVTLAVGIGANSAIFTLFNAVLLRPLPFTDPEELVEIHAVIDGTDTRVFSSGAFIALRDRATVFDGVATWASAAGTFTGEGEPERLAGAATSANYFDVVGVSPLRGRLFREGENETGSTMVVLLSEGLWRDRYGADPEIIGRTITINERAREVIGIMPAHASFPPSWRYWVPLEYTESFRDPENVYSIYLRIIARLKPGVTVEQAGAEAARVFEVAKQSASVQLPTWKTGIMPLHDYYVQRARDPLIVLFAAVGLVLLIACANLANLLLAQAATRSTDFAVRRALGASARRLMGQLLVESAVLGLVGGVIGLLLGAWGADALLAAVPPGMPQVPGVAVDGRVLLFTLAISLLAALLFGIAPALQARHAALASSLREGGRGVAGRGGARTRSALVLVETALAFALVIAAGLLIRSFDQLRRVDPGFNVENALTFDMLLPEARYDTAERVAEFWRALEARLEQVPGALAAGGINDLPLGGNATRITFTVGGRPEPAPGEEEALDVRIVTPGFFAALGVPLRRGRLLSAQDRIGAPRAVLLSEAAVARHFPDEDPIGRTIELDWTRDGAAVGGTVVGIVGDVRHDDLRDEPEPEIYLPAAQVPGEFMTFTVSTAGDPLVLRDAVKQAVRELDPSLALADVQPMRDVIAASIALDRFMSRLLAAFSGVALLLAAIGIFGVISYGVAQRRREIGVRMAVGATGRDVVRLIVRSALRLAGGGILIGFVAALALTELLQSMLFGVGRADPLTFVVGGAVLMLVALAAALLPASAAARTPPATVLNTD